MIQYSDSGVWVRTWSTPFGEISGVATDAFGDVYVADSANGQVQKFDENGAHIATWSVPGVRQIASDAHGHVFLLVFIVVGFVVDVRSDGGTDSDDDLDRRNVERGRRQRGAQRHLLPAPGRLGSGLP